MKKNKKIIIGIILFSFVVGNAPFHAQPAHAQASASYSGPTGYDTANAIEKGANATLDKGTGVVSDTVNAVLEKVGRFLANIFLLFARLLLRMATFFIDFIMVIAGYNGYLDSTAVNVGWTVVRDITNMLFIIILLVIAFATILGLEGYEWKQLLPKLLTAAILVNFSRTICGLLIDASQVVMITFLNAVSATIGGNIINAFRLPTFEAFHPNVQTQQLTSSGILSAAALALFFSGLVTAVLGAYVFILLGRLIRLWVLIVLSPLAFVLGVLPSTSSMASTWWSELMDNLVTGPVIMFFIWLSLIVVGTGQANQELIRGSKLADTSPIEQAFGPQEQMATPTDIGGWNNLANFAIAIGMLFAGAKVASSIGGSSGNLLEAGLDYGKKVALAGLGYGVIRRVAGGAHSAGRGLAGRASDFAFGKVTAPLTRGGKIIGSVLSGFSSDVERKRNEAAKKIEERRTELAKSGQLSPFGSLGLRASSWLLSSTGRLDKNVKNWQEIAELKKKQVEETYGVSGLKAGTLVGRERIRTERFEQEGAKSKALKEAERKKEFSDGVGFIADELSGYEKNLAEAKEKVARLKGSSDTEAVSAANEELGAAQTLLDDRRVQIADELKQKYKGNKKVEPAYLLEYYDKGKNMLSKAAQAEHLEHIISNNDALALARGKDALLVEEGKPPVHEQKELANQEKYYRELLGSGNYDRTMANVGTLRDAILKNQEELKSVAENISKESNPAKLAQLKSRSHALEHKDTELITEMARFMSSNASRGADFTNSATAKALEKIGDISVRADDVVGQQARELSAILQSKVASTPEAVQGALDNLRVKFGKNFDAFMESYVDGLNSAAAGGAVNKAGLFRGEYDKSENKMVYHAVRTENPADNEWLKGKRDYALAHSNCVKVTSFSGSVDLEDGVPKAVSSEAVRRFAETFGSVTRDRASRIEKSVIDEMRSMFSAMTAEQNRTLIEAMSTKNRDVEGLKTLFARIGTENIDVKSDAYPNLETYVDSIKNSVEKSNRSLEQVLSRVEASNSKVASAAEKIADAAADGADVIRRSRPNS